MAGVSWVDQQNADEHQTTSNLQVFQKHNMVGCLRERSKKPPGPNDCGCETHNRNALPFEASEQTTERPRLHRTTSRPTP